MRSTRIRFEAGARTNWHLHSERQLLLIEEGQGRVQELGGPVRVLREGERVALARRRRRAGGGAVFRLQRDA
jgi:quercetin dioxygenase-like cupin family protein